MTVQCPECGEMTVVCRLEELPDDRVRVSEVVPPPVCPFCGYKWWMEELAKEAERITADDEGGSEL